MRGYLSILAIASCVSMLGAEIDSPAPPSKSIETLIRELGSDEFETRRTAESALQTIGEGALPALRKATESDDAEISIRARKLVSTHDTVLPLLDKLADDGHTTLYYSGPTVTQMELVKLGEAAIPFIEARLKTEKSGIYRFNCVSILNSIPVPATLPILRRLARDENAWCRVEAVWSLGNVKDKESTALLFNAFENDSDETVRNEALIGFGKIAGVRLFGVAPNGFAEFTMDSQIIGDSRKELERVCRYFVKNNKLPEAERATHALHAGTIEEIRAARKSQTLASPDGTEIWIFQFTEKEWPEF